MPINTPPFVFGSLSPRNPTPLKKRIPPPTDTSAPSARRAQPAASRHVARATRLRRRPAEARAWPPRPRTPPPRLIRSAAAPLLLLRRRPPRRPEFHAGARTGRPSPGSPGTPPRAGRLRRVPRRPPPPPDPAGSGRIYLSDELRRTSSTRASFPDHPRFPCDLDLRSENTSSVDFSLPNPDFCAYFDQ